MVQLRPTLCHAIDGTRQQTGWVREDCVLFVLLLWSVGYSTSLLEQLGKSLCREDNEIKVDFGEGSRPCRCSGVRLRRHVSRKNFSDSEVML